MSGLAGEARSCNLGSLEFPALLRDDELTGREGDNVVRFERSATCATSMSSSASRILVRLGVGVEL